MDKTIAKPRLVGGILLVAGTAIGAGMLALPVVTALGGFLPASVIYLVCWLFSVATGFLLLEICLWMPQDANLVSMAKHILGDRGKYAAWVLYLFLFYSLTVAYIAGGANLIASCIQLSYFWRVLLFTGIFGTIMFFGTAAVDRINFLLMFGLILSFVVFLVIGAPHVRKELLVASNWSVAWFALPVIFTSFSYQGIIPSLTEYMNRNSKAVRLTIMIGTAIPFVCYVIWEWLIIGIVPLQGKTGLLVANQNGLDAVTPLGTILPQSSVYVLGQFFAFFAITTSFLGVTLGLLDFLADSMKISKQGAKRLLLCLIVYIPAMLIALLDPSIFLKALGYAGGIGCALLLGGMPTLMVWVGRYRKNFQGVEPQLFGGKGLLIILFIFIAFELCIEFYSELSKIFN